MIIEFGFVPFFQIVSICFCIVFMIVDDTAMFGGGGGVQLDTVEVKEQTSCQDLSDIQFFKRCDQVKIK